MRKTVRILGTHGVPAAYGGFETAAENIALFLVKKGWRVIVYCQTKGDGPITEDNWNGIERVMIPISIPGWKGTSKFDWISIKHACQFKDLCLTFGYNTAVFNTLQRLKGIPNIINMDGIEWARSRWGFTKQAILYVNERIACFVGNHLIADHPEIEKYLLTRAPKRKITTITYGAHPVNNPPIEYLSQYNLQDGKYFNLIARLIPENSILQIVEGFSKKQRGYQLAVVGKFQPGTDSYHKQILAAASDEVRFLGPIYDKETVQSIRYYSFAYVHGHTVGGTNPSLVEALAAGNPVIAHDNVYNRWIARNAALYCSCEEEFAAAVDEIINNPEKRLSMKLASIPRFQEEFTWDFVAGQYEKLLLQYHPK